MTIIINEDTIEKVRDAADIVNVVSDYVPLKRSGANYVGLCPFHNEKTPSFTVSDSKQIFHCFGCGEGGDALTFVMKMENLSFPEAVKFLGDKLGIAIEEGPKDDKKTQERNKGYEINREAARFFYSNLIKDKNSLNYLFKRKIAEPVIRKFGLGYSLNSWDSLYNHLLRKGYSAYDMERLGLISKRRDSDGYYDKFRNRIMFPIIDTRGRVLGFGGRVLDDSLPKYLNSQESYVFNKRNILYGLNLVNKLSDKKRIILVEGYMDVISLFNKGINYSVASLGTALTERQAKLLKRYGENVYLCYDQDEAGIKATDRAIQILLKEDINPKIIVLEGYKDPDDFLKENSLNNFENKLNQALHHIDYRIKINKQRYNTDDAEGKVKFTIEIAKYIKELKSPIEKDVFIEKISKDMNISKEAIQKEVFGNNIKNISKKYNKDIQTISPVSTILPSAKLIAEIDLVKLMIFNKEYFDIISNEIALDEFENFECKVLFKMINELYNSDEYLDEEILFSKVKQVANIDIELINKIAGRKPKFLPENVDIMIKDLLTTLTINKLESKRNSVKKEIEELEKKEKKNSSEEERFLKLCFELIELNKELSLIRHEEGR